MKVVLKIGVMGCAVLLLAGCDNSISKARAALEMQMTDPQSAQYRNEQMKPWGVVCGEANMKNSAGGYIGYTQYIAFPKKDDDWGAVAFEEGNYRYVSPLCSKPPSLLYAEELLSDPDSKGWYIMLNAPVGYDGLLDPKDVARLTELGYKVIVSKGGRGYIGPLKNRRSAKIVGFSMSVASKVGVRWYPSQWIF